MLLHYDPTRSLWRPGNMNSFINLKKKTLAVVSRCHAVNCNT